MEYDEDRTTDAAQREHMAALEEMLSRSHQQVGALQEELRRREAELRAYRAALSALQRGGGVY